MTNSNAEYFLSNVMPRNFTSLMTGIVLPSRAVLRWGRRQFPAPPSSKPRPCPQIFQHTGAKRSVLWPSKYAKMRFRPGFCPGPHWGSSRRSPELLVSWEGDTFTIPHRLWHLDCPTFGGLVWGQIFPLEPRLATIQEKLGLGMKYTDTSEVQANSF